MLSDVAYLDPTLCHGPVWSLSLVPMTKHVGSLGERSYSPSTGHEIGLENGSKLNRTPFQEACGEHWQRWSSRQIPR